MNTAAEERPSLGLWDIETLKGAGANGHNLYQVTRNGKPIDEPFIYRRAARKAMMNAVRIEGSAVRRWAMSQPTIIRASDLAEFQPC